MSLKKSEIAKSFEKAEWGVFLGEIPAEPTKNSNLVLFGDGQWLVRKNIIGIFQRKLNDKGLPGKDDGPVSDFKFKLPKIPLEILKMQVSFYREVMKRWNCAEAYSTVMYDLEEKKYFLTIMKQKISKAQVKYDQEGFRKEFPSNRYIEVISAHSHNSMSAYFSGVDDNDERGDMVYMVMGKLNESSPSYCIRASVAGKECRKLKISEIFDITPEQWKLLSPGWRDLHPIKWMDKLNVEAGYQSAHVQAPITHPLWPAQAHLGKRFRRSEFSGNIRSFPGTQMDFFKGFKAEEEDNDGKEMAHIGVSLAKAGQAFAPETCFHLLLESVIEMGYESEMIHAMESSGFNLVAGEGPMMEQSDEEFLQQFHDEMAEEDRRNDV